jgi:molybdopterin molybdotransferase
MALLSVEDALATMLDGAEALEAETVPIQMASGRVLAAPLTALRTQPPFPASAMDGYAVRSADVASVPARLKVIGEAPAGAPFAGSIAAGEAVRIFTGAPVPEGADAILIQENARTFGAGFIEAQETVVAGRHIRRAGLDFREGDVVLPRGRQLDPAALSLAAAANHASVAVVRKPRIAIIATGDELLPPGSTPLPGQIIASNSFGVAAIAAAAGGEPTDLGIAPDRKEAIAALIRRALEAEADVIVTLGGASVGDHDLVHEVLTGEGMKLDFWKVAMRPGKPLMFGRLGSTRVLGLPGNPVSSLVCAVLFLKPLVARLAGCADLSDIHDAVLGQAMPANDSRQDYVRARVERATNGLVASPLATQDSSMLRLLADAEGLIIRAPNAPAAMVGDACRVLMLRP